jgi:hypothetical protein
VAGEKPGIRSYFKLRVSFTATVPAATARYSGNAIQHQHVGQRQTRTGNAVKFAAAALVDFVFGEGSFNSFFPSNICLCLAVFVLV